MRWKGLSVPRSAAARSLSLLFAVRPHDPRSAARSLSPQAQCDPPIREAVRSLSPPVSTEHANVDPASLGEHRSTRCLPPQEGAYPGGDPPGGRPLANFTTARPLARTASASARRPWVSPGSGHRLWWRARFLPPPPPPRKSLENTISGFFPHPQNRPRYPQVETGYPPVVHRFIHTHGLRRARQ